MCHATLCSWLIINTGAPHSSHLRCISAIDGELWLSCGQMWLVPTQVRCTRRFACHALAPSTISVINQQITYFFLSPFASLSWVHASQRKPAKVPPQCDISDWNTQIEWVSFQRHSDDISRWFFFLASFLCVACSRQIQLYILALVLVIHQSSSQNTNKTKHTTSADTVPCT